MAKPKRPNDTGSDRHEGGTAVVTETKKKLARPSLYKVIFHNDDYTTKEFVVSVLMTVFRHTEVEATQIMMHVHNT